MFDTDCEYVQWFRLSKLVFDTDEDIVVGGVYIPSENYKYFTKKNI